MSKPFSLSKHERLKSKKQIDALFLHGEAFFIFPFKVKYHLDMNAELSGVHFGISVPKRIFKKATDRNRLKRLSREAYRLNKTALKEILMQKHLALQVMFMYSHPALLTYAEVEKGMLLCLEKLQKRINATA
ncbi:MAG: ribonuclease P protein component [Chitinophagaceae bacterium]|nr:ribonuclease P protein component [Chitinophagaceae bacterium]